MRRGLLALCLIASMVIAGCLGPSSADWGTGTGAVDVDFSMEETTVESTLSGSKQTFDGLQPVGCTFGSEGGELSASEGEAVAFSGYLGASQFYESHDSALGVQGLEHGVTTAVAIQSMSFAQAASVAGGDGPRIDVSEWSNPLRPETGTGTVDLDEFPDDDEPSGWFVLGLIPTTEHVLSGLKSLNEWHQPVVVHGYLVSSSDLSSSPYGYYRDKAYEADNDCNMVVKGGERSDALVFVSKITLDGATVSSNGNADDEWVYGDVPFLGRGVFVLFFLVGGVGGSVGLFILSKQMMMRSAKQSMRTLIGDEGMKKAASVKSDAKAAKKAGMESPEQRQKRVDKERRQAEKKQERTVPEKAPKKTEDALGGFDLDSVLASTSTPSGSGGGPSGRKSSVVVSEAAKEMSRTATNTSPAPAPSPTVTQQRGPPRTKQPPAAEEERKPTVRRRRAVKKISPPKEETPAPKYDEEEEFSDFSF